MGLLELMKSSGVQTGDHSLSTDQLLGVDDQAITPTNAGKFGIFRSTPVLKEPRSFTEAEANGLTELASKRAIEAQATKKAVNALMTIKNADTSEQKDYNLYRQHEARKTYQQVKSNAETGNAIAGLSSKYAHLHESVRHRLAVEDAKKQAITGKSEAFSKLW